MEICAYCLKSEVESFFWWELGLIRWVDPGSQKGKFRNFVGDNFEWLHETYI